MTPTEFQKRIDALPSKDLKVFSDGSELVDGSAGAGATMRQYDRQISEIRKPLGPHFEVYDAELEGALAGLKAAYDSPGTHLATNIHVILYNQEAARRLLDDCPTRTSQDVILEFRQIAARWPHRHIHAHVRPGKVNVMWSPGHMGIAGNEKADILADEAAKLPAPLKASLTGAKTLAKRTVRQMVIEWWHNSAPDSYKELGLQFPKDPPEELLLSRRHLGFLKQCRTGHGDFAAYHERLKHTDAVLRCSCRVARKRRAENGRDRAMGTLDFC